MKKVCGYRAHIFMLITVLLLSVATAGAGVAVEGVRATDVTPTGFALIWRTSGISTPDIAVFSDAAGTDKITAALDVTVFPLQGGDPEISDSYQNQLAMDSLRNKSSALGLIKISVQGCLPETTYYYRVYVQGAFWPPEGLAAVTTNGVNAFVSDSRQILVNLNTDTGAPDDVSGWIVTASSLETLHAVSSVVGDGAGANQAFLNLSNLFGLDGKNWTPTGPRAITITVFNQSGFSLPQTTNVVFEGNYSVAVVQPVDILVDDILDVDGDGLSTSQEGVAGTNPNNPDTDSDGMPDGWEAKNQTDPLVDDAGGDNDSDTYTNIEEYQAGSDPNSSDSIPPDAGDITGDGIIDLQDAILALQILVGIESESRAYTQADISGDSRIGIEEMIYIMQKTAGL
ncbi:hypothetical protein ACFL9U_01580 [Thermodesulfobacteriota bacterium]